MKILVTGGTGLVGNSLKELVINDNQNEWIFIGSHDLNLLNETNTIQYISDISPDIVVHLAAKVGGLYNNMKNNEKMFIDNLTMNMNIIKASEIANVQKFVAILSTCIFPDNPPSLPLHENMIHSGLPHYSNIGYAFAKRMLDVHCNLSNMNTICLIPTNLYGKYDNFKIEDAHVIPALIHKCYLAKKHNKPFVIYGSGNSLRQFLYNEDFAKIILWAVNNQFSNKHESFICTPEQELSVKYVANLIAHEFNYSDNIIFDNSPDGQYKKTASNQKLLNNMSSFQFSDFDQKLKETIQWFIQNYDILRK